MRAVGPVRVASPGAVSEPPASGRLSCANGWKTQLRPKGASCDRGAAMETTIIFAIILVGIMVGSVALFIWKTK
jgi:hypothetical protein